MNLSLKLKNKLAKTFNSRLSREFLSAESISRLKSDSEDLIAYKRVFPRRYFESHDPKRYDTGSVRVLHLDRPS